MARIGDQIKRIKKKDKWISTQLSEVFSLKKSYLTIDHICLMGYEEMGMDENHVNQRNSNTPKRYLLKKILCKLQWR